jgi:hypothetical protein
MERINDVIRIDDVVERRHARAPQTPAGKAESKLDRFADKFDRWFTRLADKLLPPDVAETLVGPHKRTR